MSMDDIRKTEGAMEKIAVAAVAATLLYSPYFLSGASMTQKECGDLSEKFNAFGQKADFGMGSLPEVINTYKYSAGKVKLAACDIKFD